MGCCHRGQRRRARMVAPLASGSVGCPRDGSQATCVAGPSPSLLNLDEYIEHGVGDLEVQATESCTVLDELSMVLPCWMDRQNQIRCRMNRARFGQWVLDCCFGCGQCKEGWLQVSKWTAELAVALPTTGNCGQYALAMDVKAPVPGSPWPHRDCRPDLRRRRHPYRRRCRRVGSNKEETSSEWRTRDVLSRLISRI